MKKKSISRADGLSTGITDFLILVNFGKRRRWQICAKELAETNLKRGSAGRLFRPSDAAVAKVNDIYKKVIYCKHKDYEQVISVKRQNHGTVSNKNKTLEKVMVWFDF